MEQLCLLWSLPVTLHCCFQHQHTMPPSTCDIHNASIHVYIMRQHLIVDVPNTQLTIFVPAPDKRSTSRASDQSVPCTTADLQANNSSDETNCSVAIPEHFPTGREMRRSVSDFVSACAAYATCIAAMPSFCRKKRTALTKRNNSSKSRVQSVRVLKSCI